MRFQKFGIGLTLWLGLMVTPLCAQESPTDFNRFIRWGTEDAWALVQGFDQHTVFYGLGSLALLAPLSLVDEPLDDQPIAGQSRFLDRYLDITNELGGPRMAAPVLGLFALSLATDNHRFQDAAFTSGQALAYTGVIVYSLKFLLGRHRPNEGVGAYTFRPFSGHTSFPSGHAAAAFAIVTPWVMYYPSPLTYGLYVLAASTAFARITRDKHWLTDVLAGSTIGFLTARWLSKRHQNKNLLPSKMALTPLLTPQGLGLRLRISID